MFTSRKTGDLAGAMDGDYAAERQTDVVLAWRYRMRARAAADLYLERGGRTASPRVLELGAADGRTLVELRRLLGDTGEYVGVEISDALIGAAGTLPNNVRLHRGDVRALPADLGEGRFDFCVALAVLEHLPDPAAALAEARRILAPGGVLVASCPSPIWDRAASALGLVRGEHHESALNRRALERLFADAGFEGFEHRPFMWAPTAIAPYFGRPLGIDASARVDAMARRLRMPQGAFVNQLVAAVRPR